jgi:glycosyltransferase involved in cell wall biosynthesis
MKIFPKVSVVVPAYNSERYILYCINSILQQTFKNWELFIVVSPSTDNTVGVIKKYFSNDPRIHLIEEKTKGTCASARNTGFAKTTGEYIVFLDSDDWWEFGKLECQVKQLDSDPSLEWVSHDLIVEREDESRCVWKNPIRVTSHGDTFGGMHTILFRRTTLESIKSKWGYLFNEEMSHTDDTDLVARLGPNYHFAMAPYALSGFRRNPSGISFHVNGNDVELTTVKIAIRNKAWSILECVNYTDLICCEFNKLFGCDIVAWKKKVFG